MFPCHGVGTTIHSVKKYEALHIPGADFSILRTAFGSTSGLDYPLFVAMTQVENSGKLSILTAPP